MENLNVSAETVEALENMDTAPENEAQEDSRVEIANRQTRRRANAYFISKLVFNIFLMILGTLLIVLFLKNMQTKAAYEKQRKNSEIALEEAISILNENEADAAEITGIYHDSNREVLDDIDLLLSGGLFDSIAGNENEVGAAIFSDLATRSGVADLQMLSMDGKIVYCPDVSLIGTNPATFGVLTQENVNALLRGTQQSDGTVSPVPVKNRFGTFYYYSKPIIYQDVRYMLVLGVDSSVLDVQIESLRDLASVLSRISVNNKGFLFAVDRERETFLYYKHGNEMLTGQRAADAGLSKDALADGYSGEQTINGTEYFCVSRQYGRQTIVCAIAQTAEILAADTYVVFWSVFGFIVIMLICLAYTVIVRNDFVRNAVKTDRLVVNPHFKTPVYFDKSIFKKVFPLLMICVLLMFGISFYTQTLLEITEGIEKSSVALQEVTGRYDEGNVSREVIENYYNDRFLSKAHLISFLIEEDPGILNTASENYYSTFDEDGRRIFLTDDEGNPLKSVANSEKLQELCDANGIEAIYIFDEDGRTIATNTPNWSFELSHDEASQSYPFLEVLQGKKDAYIQDPMTNDMGEHAQYIGVRFNYYTRELDDGQMVYASRYDYLTETQNGTVSASTLTKHSSLIQIALNTNLFGKLLESTDVGTILSTNMLRGGYIVLFDATEDHVCLYSPNQASIGRTAADLGVSPKAFSGDDYYGFNRINGITYLQYFRFQDGYFIATAIPKNEMFVARAPIAFMTAVVSLTLVLILTMTVTLTSKEEEHLYETMSEDQALKGWNSVFYNTILPSGRNTSTMRAAARWDNRRVPWSERRPEQKLMIIAGTVFGLLIIYFVVSIYVLNLSPNTDSILKYIISGAWDRGPNIFAFSCCAIVLAAAILAIQLLRVPVRILTALMGARGETIAHLLLSVAKYGGTIGAVFYCMYLLGTDPGSLLASAGILSLVIGLGAQSLIKDILAGIFIVFEGEFRVGDIVTINNYRGTVMDIGLRTTKIMAPDGNIKIYNNSDITGVLNMTKQTSTAIARISIEYGQDIDYVEAVLERELPAVGEANPKIIEGPTYGGVAALEDSGVQLILFAKCSEQDIFAVQRYLNKAILQIFYRNNINVPFPNVTVSGLDISDRKTLEDLTGTKKNTEDPGDEKTH